MSEPTQPGSGSPTPSPQEHATFDEFAETPRSRINARNKERGLKLVLTYGAFGALLLVVFLQPTIHTIGALYDTLTHRNASPTAVVPTPNPSATPGANNADVGANVESSANSSRPPIARGSRYQDLLATPTPALAATSRGEAPAPAAVDTYRRLASQSTPSNPSTDVVVPPQLPPSTSIHIPDVRPPMINLPTPAQTPHTTPEPPAEQAGSYVPNPSQYGPLLAAVPQQQAGGFIPAQEPASTAQTASRAAFLEGRSAPVYTSAREEQARSRTEVFPGQKIWCQLDDTINTSLPGFVFAHITRDVRASLPPYPVVFPAGTGVSGAYNADTHPGDDRVAVRWEKMVLPNGTTYQLQNVQAASTDGSNGFTADVNNHIGRVYSTLFLGSVLAGAAGAVANGSNNGYPSVGQAAIANVGAQVANAASSAVQAQVAQPPTLVVKSGTAFTISFVSVAPVLPYSRTHLPPAEDAP